MREGQVFYARNWEHPEIRELRHDCMLPLQRGMYYHSRLKLIICIKEEMAPAFALHLPFV